MVFIDSSVTIGQCPNCKKEVRRVRLDLGEEVMIEITCPCGRSNRGPAVFPKYALPSTEWKTEAYRPPKQPHRHMCRYCFEGKHLHHDEGDCKIVLEGGGQCCCRVGDFQEEIRRWNK